MKTISQIKFDRIIKEGFHELLKPLGFKKKANNFYLKLDTLGQIINIQKSMWYSKDHIHFTINTGLFLPAYWVGLVYNQGKEIPAFPTEPECVIRRRIGELRNQNDTWYDIDEATDEQQLITAMRENLSEFILPHFNRLNNLEMVLQELDNDLLMKLIVYGELKQFDIAKREYAKLLKEKMHPNFLGTVKEYAQKYGLEG